MNYEEARAKVQVSREYYGSQWKEHLDRYGPIAYFYELAGILGRLESIMTNPTSRDETFDEVQDKLLDLGNYASFIYDWIEEQKAKVAHQVFKDKLP